MGTRGAAGFRIDGEDKVTYNHWDSYPSSLGNEVAKFLKKFSDVEALKEIAKNIVLVDDETIPTDEQISQAKELGLFNGMVGKQQDTDWYCLLRNSQGDLSVYEKYKYMIDSHDFLKDSLFCEWAYIINLDTECLEIYKGFNKDRNARGRYAALYTKDTAEYFGVALYKTIHLKNFFGKDVDLTYIEKEDEDE
jgi:hypothetical protein